MIGHLLLIGSAVLVSAFALGMAVWAEVSSRRERKRRRAALHSWVEHVFTECVPDLRSEADRQAWLGQHGGVPPKIPPLPL